MTELVLNHVQSIQAAICVDNRSNPKVSDSVFWDRKRESIGHTGLCRFPFPEVVELFGWIPVQSGIARTKRNHYKPKGGDSLPAFGNTHWWVSAPKNYWLEASKFTTVPPPFSVVIAAWLAAKSLILKVTS